MQRSKVEFYLYIIPLFEYNANNHYIKKAPISSHQGRKLEL